jgi:hypothetical protein
LDSLPESSRPLQLGWLTSSDRDFGAQARKDLLRFGGPSVLEDLTTLESGAILLCLDDQEVCIRHCLIVYKIRRFLDKQIMYMYPGTYISQAMC